MCCRRSLSVCGFELDFVRPWPLGGGAQTDNQPGTATNSKQAASDKRGRLAAFCEHARQDKASQMRAGPVGRAPTSSKEERAQRKSIMAAVLEQSTFVHNKPHQGQLKNHHRWHKTMLSSHASCSTFKEATAVGAQTNMMSPQHCVVPQCAPQLTREGI
jgi:hypothetical protein